MHFRLVVFSVGLSSVKSEKIEVFDIDWRTEREVGNQQERNGVLRHACSAARADAVSQERHRSASESVLGAGCDVVQRPSGLAQFPARMAH
jgi:hypothetical protein